MPRLFISRLFESFFRRKWLYLLALVPFVALGVVTTLNSKDVYKSSATIQVNKSTPLDEDNPFSGPSATVTATQVNTVLGIDEFLDIVIEKAGLTETVKSGALTRQDVRNSISASAIDPEDLVAIKTTSASADLSKDLASATIDGFRSWQTTNLKQQSSAALDAFVEAGNDEGAAKARQSTQLAEAIVSQRYPTRSEPIAADAPEPHRKKDVVTVVLFLIFGLIVSGGALVVATLLDRSVRYGEEIESHLHVPVLASVPNSRAAITPLVV